jgi:uncharacterized protein YndB with AHSA1/START domain
MASIERVVEVTTPLERVWSFLTDFTTTEQWDPPTQSTVLVSGDGGVGSVYRNVSKILGHETEIEYTVTEVQPHSRFRLHAQTDSMSMVDTMDFEQTPDGGTRVVYSLEVSPEGVAKLAEPLMPLGLKKLGDDAAEQMTAVLQGL